MEKHITNFIEGLKMTLEWKEQITSNINICHGKVCIKGTRVMISVILDCVAEGMGEEAESRILVYSGGPSRNISRYGW